MAQFFHHNDFGYCARCPRTQHLHLCFGNLALAATLDDFFLFKEHIGAIYYEQHLLPKDPEERCIAVRTPAQKMAMVFTAIELAQLWEILENTALLLEVEKILADNAQR
ncbi:DUF6686 family protein [Hymenobacter crusticola]|uniref:Uncharacterized protein n=1 Tax=Hymenobacter crusticola TaxID=1770526 RepID=A0A243WB22_9BACT|nr:DUF6686 family protein [Hymenobacter crusticola]OUJ72682.1 hypothetical protein BXP70_17390 [Hymenobacter crusticola]